MCHCVLSYTFIYCILENGDIIIYIYIISVNINEHIIHEYILHTPTLHQKKPWRWHHSGCPNNGLPNSTTNHSRVIQPGCWRTTDGSGDGNPPWKLRLWWLADGPLFSRISIISADYDDQNMGLNGINDFLMINGFRMDKGGMIIPSFGIPFKKKKTLHRGMAIPKVYPTFEHGTSGYKL